MASERSTPAAQKDDVRPSGKALQQAASWLGISDPEKVLEEDSAAAAFQPRPEGLGLGAKFLAHHKAAHLTMPLEKRFGKRLQRSTTEDADTAAMPSAKQAHARTKAGAAKEQKAPDSSDDEDVGRSAAFGARKGLKTSSVNPYLSSKASNKKKKQKRSFADPHVE